MANSWAFGAGPPLKILSHEGSPRISQKNLLIFRADLSRNLLTCKYQDLFLFFFCQLTVIEVNFFP